MKSILEKLRGGDRRSIGKSEQVVAQILKQPALFADLIDGMLDADELVRMRAADAVEKITVTHSDWLQPHKRKILREIARVEQQEVRWHVAQILPRIKLTAREKENAFAILNQYLTDKSGIVRTFAMQALADFALQDEHLRETVTEQIKALTRTGTPAMQSRGRKLLAQLAKPARPARHSSK